MMDDYIKREAVFALLRDDDFCVTSILDIPAADVAPVVHGRWVKNERFPDFRTCSVCGLETGGLWSGRPFKYCPNCGARMDGEG